MNKFTYYSTKLLLPIIFIVFLGITSVHMYIQTASALDSCSDCGEDASALNSDSLEINLLKQNVYAALRSVPANLIKFNPMLFDGKRPSGLWEIIAGQSVFYTDNTGRFLIMGGQLFDTIERKNLTKEKMAQLNVGHAPAQKISLTELDINNAIKISEGSRVLYEFSDPDCQFCRRAHKELANLKDTAVYVFLYPIESLHPEAKQKSISAWCSKDRREALDKILRGEQIEEKNCDNPVEKNIAFANKHGINGTPTFILSDGTMVRGFKSAEYMNRLLSEAKVAKK